MTTLKGRPSDYRYVIQTHEAYGFFTGKSRGKQQVLMGLACPNLIAFFFNLDGDLIHVTKRFQEYLVPSSVFVDGKPLEGIVQTFDIYDPRIPVRLSEWQAEIGFQEQPITVKRFSNAETGIGIGDYPDHFAEVLSDPNASDDEKDNVLQSLPEWEADGQFVFWWGNDYWLNANGDVTSS